MEKEGSEPLIALFDQSSVLSAVKAACLALPEEGLPTDAPLQGFGEALLQLNDLAGSRSLPIVSRIRTEAELRQWIYYLFVLGVFYHKEHYLHALARSFDLYLSDKPLLRSKAGSYVDFPALVERATGLDPNRLWAILFAFLVHFRAINIQNVHEVHATISRSTYFRDYLFTEEETERFFSLVAQPLTIFKSAVQASYSFDNILPYHSLALAHRPLILAGDLAFAPSLPLLLRKVTTGLYHLLLNASADGKERARIQVHLGDVFEDYVDRLLHRAVAAHAPDVRYFGPNDLRAALKPSKGSTPQVCDGLIIHGRSAVLIETKAKQFTAAARAGADSDGFFEKLSEIFVGGARQLNGTVDLLRSGKFASLGIEEHRIETILPVLVLLEDFPMFTPIYDWIAKIFEENALFIQRGVRPFQSLSVEEAEFLGMALEEGQDLFGILSRKSTDDYWKRQAFRNFSLATGVGRPIAQRSATLAELFNSLTENMQAFLRSRAKSPATLD